MRKILILCDDASSSEFDGLTNCRIPKEDLLEWIGLFLEGGYKLDELDVILTNLNPDYAAFNESARYGIILKEISGLVSAGTLEQIHRKKNKSLKRLQREIVRRIYNPIAKKRNEITKPKIHE